MSQSKPIKTKKSPLLCIVDCKKGKPVYSKKTRNLDKQIEDGKEERKKNNNSRKTNVIENVFWFFLGEKAYKNERKRHEKITKNTQEKKTQKKNERAETEVCEKLITCKFVNRNWK